MPLRFRSVVPYTLPGVLALIGWWWYISRKKERITSHDSLEGVPATVSHLSTPVEGSNGLVEKGTVSPTNDTETSTHPQSSRNRPSKAKEQRSTEQEVAQVHLPNTEPSQEQSSEVADSHSDRVRTEEIHKPSVSALPPHNIKEFPAFQVSVKDDKDPERNLAPDLVTESGKHIVKDPTADPDSIVEATVLPCQSAQLTQVTSTSPTVADLANAERPEPEGEVATQEVVVPCVAQPVKDHLTAITTKDCPVTPAKAHRAITPEADSLETHVLAQGFRHHVLTSIPTSPASTLTPVAQAPAQDSTSPAVASEDILVSSTSGEEQDLELLAAGLITEVISAATQEVLGVTSCQDTDNSQPSCSSTPLANGRPCSQQEPAQQQHMLPTGLSQIGCEFREAELVEEAEQGMPNGCSSAPVWEPTEASHREIEIQNELRGHWPTTSHQAAQGAPLPNLVKLKTEGGSALAEDSACSTCHSEDGVSSEDLQNSIPDNQTDLIQVTDMSAGDPAQPLAETAPETTVLSLAEANTVDTVCEIKRLNGLGLRNGAHGTSEVETDQSGGSDVNSMDSMDSGCTMGVGDSQSNNATASSSDVIIWEIEVPKHLVGRLIGKQGRYVSFLKQNSGAKIYISTLPYTQEFQICHIEGTQQQVDKALSLIGKKFKDLDLTNLYAPPPPPLTLPSLPMTSWLLLPSGVTVEVIVVNIVSAGHVFVQQHTHPTYHALRSLDQQMFLCYSQPGTPALPSPAEVGVICAAPAVEGAWWRAQVITFYKETNEVEIRYVDYGGYDRVKIDSLRQIRSDFVTLPFQGAEVLLDNIAPLPGEDRFSAEATSALEEMTRGVPLLAQVSNYDNNTGLPLVQLWNMVGDELILVNRTLAERGLGVWVDGF
ncbi:A kinase (PRKA) anchor protein 1b [Myripristis murdjan]|uniref:A kinase (PRKA) anchor protein 1b n=1 Tax=Myripristis murdjan TaxID=586833 RepID=A0A668ACY5_9TELE|nr:A-kinase anchor protein 1, mitochondrial [Myripristis murdjan]